MILDKPKIAAKALIIKLKNIVDNIYTKRGDRFKIFNNKDFELLVELCSSWFLSSKPDIFKEEKLQSIIQKVNDNNKSFPKVYRGLSFATKAEFDKFLKAKKVANREIASYTSDIKVAREFATGQWNNGKYYVILELPPKEVKNNLIFSLESLFDNEEDKKLFLTRIIQLDAKHNLDYIYRTKLKSLSSNELTGSIRGAFYSVTESEYVLSPDVPIIIMETYEKK